MEVFGGEYVFGGGNTSYSGVTVQRPKVPPTGSGWTFYQTVDIAVCRFSRDHAMREIQELKAQFPASSYDLMARNCNHFADALCQRLCAVALEWKIPSPFSIEWMMKVRSTLLKINKNHEKNLIQ